MRRSNVLSQTQGLVLSFELNLCCSKQFTGLSSFFRLSLKAISHSNEQET